MNGNLRRRSVSPLVARIRSRSRKKNTLRSKRSPEKIIAGEKQRPGIPKAKTEHGSFKPFPASFGGFDLKTGATRSTDRSEDYTRNRRDRNKREHGAARPERDDRDRSVRGRDERRESPIQAEAATSVRPSRQAEVTNGLARNNGTETASRDPRPNQNDSQRTASLNLDTGKNWSSPAFRLKNRPLVLALIKTRIRIAVNGTGS